MAWRDQARRGTAWPGMARHGTAWRGEAGYGMTRQGEAWRGREEHLQKGEKDGDYQFEDCRQDTIVDAL